MVIVPFRAEADKELLHDLRERLARVAWPEEVDGGDWSHGVPVAWMRDLTTYWREGFDWRAVEARINALPNYRAMIDGAGIHFVHQPGVGPNPMPLLIVHGWPSSFVEMLDIIPMLADPGAHGGDPSDAFDVVVPSLPGFGYSDRPPAGMATRDRFAELLAGLMVGLGYSPFAAHAHDIGASAVGRLAIDRPDMLIAYSTTEPGIPAPYFEDRGAPLSEVEDAYRSLQAEWDRAENAYGHLQSTRPTTLAYGLADSPVAMAAWILDKWHSWTAPASGDLLDAFSRDHLLANVTLYWVTRTIDSANRYYYDSPRYSRPIGPQDRIRVPTGVTLTATQPIERAPRVWAERMFTDIRDWNELPRGGHFVLGEEPTLMSERLRTFLRGFR